MGLFSLKKAACKEAWQLPSRTEKAFCKEKGNDLLLSMVNRHELSDKQTYQQLENDFLTANFFLPKVPI